MNNCTSQGRLIVLSGPSGTGKSTVISALMKIHDKLAFSVSATTRSPRPGEVEGKDYFFVTRERFEEMVSQGQLLEHAEFVGNCYGTPRGPVLDKLNQGITVLLDIEVQGAMQVMESMPEAISVFLFPPSLEVLEQRLRNRGTESEEVIVGRLETAKKEMEFASRYDFTIVNDVAEKAAARLLEIIETGKNKE